MARKRGLSTVQQALRLLAYLADHPEGVGAKEVARLLGKSLSSAYALLHSLMEEGFVVKEEGGFRLARQKPIPSNARNTVMAFVLTQMSAVVVVFSVIVRAVWVVVCVAL